MGGATLKDVAGLAEVAVITASRVLNGGASGLPVSPATRQRVERAAQQLGYRPHAHGRTLRDRSSRQVGALAINNPDQPLTNLPGYEFLLGINAGLADAGWLLALVRLTDLGDPARVRALQERLLDGFIVVSRVPEAVAERLHAASEPVVWLDTGHRAATGCLHRDERQAGADAAGLLLAAGRRRVVWMRRPPERLNHFSLHDRAAGARAACAAAGAEFVEVAGSPPWDLPDPRPLLAELRQPATGLLLADPPQARWAAGFLAEHGLAPGRDVGVAACDADQPMADSWPGLARVGYDRYALGQEAAAMLLARLAGGRLPASRVQTGTVVAGTTA